MRDSAHPATRIIVRAVMLCWIGLMAGCQRDPPAADRFDQIARSPASTASSADGSQFAAAVQALFLSDTMGTELRGQLSVQVLAPELDDETPLVQRELPDPSEPGPHTLEGVLYADLQVLRQLFGSGVELRVEGDRVHFPAEGVTLLGHWHGDALYVPVRPFARRYGAYARIWGALANSGVIWPREILQYWKEHGPGGAPALLEAEAEGLISGIDASPRPGQY